MQLQEREQSVEVKNVEPDLQYVYSEGTGGRPRLYEGWKDG